MQLGIGLALTAARARSRRWSPAALFAGGQPGHWPGGYDPADRRMWSDVNGQTPVLTFGAPVALALDMSRGGELGPELVPNPNFDGGLTGWTSSGLWSWADGEATLIGSPDSSSQLTTPALIEQYTFYRINAAARYGAAAGRLQQSVVSGPASAVLLADFITWNMGNATTRSAVIFRTTAPIEAYLSRYSMRQIMGYQSLQTTSANRPLTAVDGSIWYLDRSGGKSLPITLPAGTYGRAAVDKDGVVTIDTVVNPTETLVVDDQRDVIFRLGAYDVVEDAQIRQWWAA